VRNDEEVERLEAEERRQAEVQARQMQFQHAETGGYGVDEEAAQLHAEQVVVPVPQPVLREGPKIGRNDPCPCGSGKKYKQCHGQLV
jgi:preprotein translocase subunit SecA